MGADDDFTFTHAPLNAIDALKWCRRHRGTIRFESDDTVTVIAYGRAARAGRVGDAMTALRPLVAEQAEATTEALAKRRGVGGWPC